MQNITLQDIKDSGISEPKLCELFVEENDTIKELTEEPESEAMKRIKTTITDESSTVNGYCLPRYADIFPWNPVPDIVKKITKILFKYSAYSRRDAVDERLETAYKNAFQMLRDIKDGILKLTEDDGVTEKKSQEDSIISSSKTPEDRVFKDPRGFIL